MLAERVMEWTEQWKQEGFREGFQEGFQEGFREGFREGFQEGLEEGEVLERARGVLLRDLERRFGSLPEEVRQRVDTIASIEDVIEFSLRAGAAPSLAALAAL
jgi:flagellar biosynthesis/type III secretory pathway protein FliH